MNAKATPTSDWWRDLLTAVLGLWLVAAVYADGWAHLNVPGLESFFTPWHGALYAGLTVFAAWIAVLAWRGAKASGTREMALSSVFVVTNSMRLRRFRALAK